MSESSSFINYVPLNYSSAHCKQLAELITHMVVSFAAKTLQCNGMWDASLQWTFVVPVHHLHRCTVGDVLLSSVSSSAASLLLKYFKRKNS